jgi:clan AA aspartic protease (TIGR02281 family)
MAKMAVVPLVKTTDGYFQIQASINGVNATFILDTGASGTIIDIGQLDKFGLKIDDAKVNGVQVGDAEAGNIETFPLAIDSFSIGKHQLNIKSIFANESGDQLETHVVGLIGQDALSELNALVDLAAPQLLIPEAPNDLQSLLGDKQSPNYQAIDLHPSAIGLRFVNAKLDQHDVRLLVDSGASETVLDETLMKQLGFSLEDHPSAKTVLSDGSELPMKVLKNQKLSLGNATLDGDFFISDFTALMNAINQDQQSPFVGILGNKQMLEMNSIIDLSNHKLYIKH